MKVLSGSSIRKMRPKTIAAVVRSSTANTVCRGSALPSRAPAPAARRAILPRRARHTLSFVFGISGGEATTLLLLLGLPLLLALGLLIAVLAQQRNLRARLARLETQRPVGAGDLAALRADLGQALRHVAVVRYDAFGDMGGRLSFSAAIIDDEGDGLVLTSIHARGESRTYGKGIVKGSSDTTLTPEEQQALAAARTGKDDR